MGKFDGILFVSDLDDTLLDNDKRVSEENKKAIKYFEDEGGSFSFITGRIPLGAKPILEQLTPKIPFGCINGGGIYDKLREEYVWKLTLPESVLEMVDFVREVFPTTGIEVCTFDGSYFCHKNELTEIHRQIENFPDRNCHQSEIKEPVSKILLIDEEENIPKLIKALAKNPKSAQFDFVRSTSQYYEIVPKGASKGNAMLKLAEILGINPAKTISIGDNDNDVSMLKAARIGFAVENASKNAKACADFITVSNNDNAIAKVVEMLDCGEIEMGL